MIRAGVTAGVAVSIAAALLAMTVAGCNGQQQPQGMWAPSSAVPISGAPAPPPAPSAAPVSPDTVAGLRLLASDATSDVLREDVQALADARVPAPAEFLYGSQLGEPTMQATIWWVVEAEAGGGPKGAQAAMTMLLAADMEPLTDRDSVAIDGGSMYCQQVRDPDAGSVQVSCGFYRDGLQGMVSSFDGDDYDVSVDLLTQAVTELSAANAG